MATSATPRRLADPAVVDDLVSNRQNKKDGKSGSLNVAETGRKAE